MWNRFIANFNGGFEWWSPHSDVKFEQASKYGIYGSWSTHTLQEIMYQG